MTEIYRPEVDTLSVSTSARLHMGAAVTIDILDLQLFILMGTISPTWNAASLPHPCSNAIYRVVLPLGSHARAENHAVEFHSHLTDQAVCSTLN